MFTRNQLEWIEANRDLIDSGNLGMIYKVLGGAVSISFEEETVLALYIALASEEKFEFKRDFEIGLYVRGYLLHGELPSKFINFNLTSGDPQKVKNGLMAFLLSNKAWSDEVPRSILEGIIDSAIIDESIYTEED